MDISSVRDDVITPLKSKPNEFDEYVLTSFLESKLNISKRGYESYKSVILAFLNYCNKDLHTVSERDCKNYFRSLDISELKLSSKNQYRAVLKSFFDKYEKSYKRKFREFYMNPILDKDEYVFGRDNDLTKTSKEETMSEKQILQNLKKAKMGREDLFILHLLLTFCGMRISEAISVRIDDINLKERYLETGKVDSARKSNRDEKKPLIFILPKEIVPFLFEFIMYQKTIYGDPEFLFESRHARNTVGYMTRPSFVHHVKKFEMTYIDKMFHDYRTALTTTLTHDKNGDINLYRAEYLTNHKISGATAQHYVKFSIKQRRNLYDKSMEGKYVKIKKWLKNV